MRRKGNDKSKRDFGAYMIYVGLTSWGDHPSLYFNESTSSKYKLVDYSAHFPIVEVDSAFYAIPSVANVEKWCKETPASFRFVVKAYQGMTGHLREDLPFDTKNDMFDAFKEAIQAFHKHGKLGLILFQFPPWFDCEPMNINYLRYIRQQLPNERIAIEFRNQTWFHTQMQDKTLQFLQEMRFIHTICDEPQAGVGSIPFVPEITHEDVLIRMHGRNLFGWRNIGNTENWRKVRFLYDYSKEELMWLAEQIRLLEKRARNIYVLFNNNSDYHAAPNAKALLALLNIEFKELSPKQLNIFEGDLQ